MSVYLYVCVCSRVHVCVCVCGRGVSSVQSLLQSCSAEARKAQPHEGRTEEDQGRGGGGNEEKEVMLGENGDEVESGDRRVKRRTGDVGLRGL